MTPHRRHLRRWRGRHPAVRWDLQRLMLRARGERDEFSAAHSHFWCDTTDGVRIAGSRVGDDPDTAVVLVHGFMGYRTKRPYRFLAERLSERFTVLAFDLRGHGQSGGHCTGGEKEALDVHAVVSYARARGFRRVVTVGASLGGIAVVGEAARYHDVDAVVAISTPAVWGTSPRRAVRRAQWLFLSRTGRALARRLMGTRIHLGGSSPDPPSALASAIAPIPLLIVHGADDHFFPVEDAHTLFESAGEPKSLMIREPFGHAEDGFTTAFASELTDAIDRLLPVGRPA